MFHILLSISHIFCTLIFITTLYSKYYFFHFIDLVLVKYLFSLCTHILTHITKQPQSVYLAKNIFTHSKNVYVFFPYNVRFVCFSFQFCQILFHVSSTVTALLGACTFRIVKSFCWIEVLCHHEMSLFIPGDFPCFEVFVFDTKITFD